MCLPHTRGGEPGQCQSSATQPAVCPTRVGMNLSKRLKTARSAAVCPTRVGMNRPATVKRRAVSRLPHTRGDEPRARSF